MTKNGASYPNLTDDDEADDVPTDVHMLKGMVIATRGEVSRVDSRLTVIEKDIAELNATMRGGVMAIKIVGGIIGAAAVIGPALSWALTHVSLK